MTFLSRWRPNAPALLAMLMLHAGLLAVLLAQRQHLPPQTPGQILEPVQWLLPLAPRPKAAARQPDVAAPGVRERPSPVRLATVARDVAAAAPTRERDNPTAEPAPTPATSVADPFDLSAPQPAPAAGALLDRQPWGAGKADHELRGGKLAKLVRPTDTLQAGLERAFYEAGEAVPPKWFSAPEIREISVPESRMRMYKIRTGMGTYCFYKPDPSLQAGYDYKLMTCPREK